MNNLIVHIRNHLAHEQYLRKEILTQKGSLFVSTAAGIITELKVATSSNRFVAGWSLVSDPSDPKGMKWVAPVDKSAGIAFTQDLMIPDAGDSSTVSPGLIWYMPTSIDYIVDTYRIVGSPAGSCTFTFTGGLALVATASSQSDTGNKVANKNVLKGTVTTITLTSCTVFKGVTISLACRYK
jgi:hypothetical protein